MTCKIVSEMTYNVSSGIPYHTFEESWSNVSYRLDVLPDGKYQDVKMSIINK